MAFSIDKIPVLGSLFGSGEEDFARSMERMKQAYMRYRPEMEQARMRGLQQNLAAFAPVNDWLERAYGSGARFDTEALGQNPLHPPPPVHALPPGSSPRGAPPQTMYGPPPPTAPQPFRPPQYPGVRGGQGGAFAPQAQGFGRR